MILEWFMDAIGAVVSFIAGLLPNADTSTWWVGFSGFASHMTDLNYFLPIEELFTFTLGFIAVFVVFGPMKIVLWLLSWVRGGAQA